MPKIEVTEADKALAKEVLVWMEGLNEQPEGALTDYLANLATYGRIGYTNLEGLGIVCSAVAAYQKTNADKLAKAARVPAKHSSAAVGERICRRVRFEFGTSYDTMYGTMHLHKFRVLDGDDTGAVLMWKTNDTLQSPQADEPGHAQFIRQGDEFWLTGTIKEHSEYKGEAQTIVNRCSASATETKPKKTKKKKETV